MKKTLVLTICIFIILTNWIPIIKSNEQISYNTHYNKSMIIICPSKFLDELQPLANHKNSIGINTTIKTTDDIYIEYSGRDKQERIKYFIKDAYDTYRIQYILLVGNFIDIPIRYIYNLKQHPSVKEAYFISDLYYADIYNQNKTFSNWDSNNNGIYGEWNGDKALDSMIDLYPDVYLGRLACWTSQEVDNMVEKIITYENTSYNSNWFNRFVVVAGDTFIPGFYPFDTPLFEGEEITKISLNYMNNFEHIKLWTSDKSFSNFYDVIKAINDGCGFIEFEGHSVPKNWFTHPPNESRFINGISTLTIPFLKNKDMYPICIVGGCNSLQFDIKINILYNISFIRKIITIYQAFPECWGWAITRKKDGGAIATIGNTGLGYTKEDKESFEGGGGYLRSQFFYEYSVNKFDFLGEVWAKTISSYLDKFPIEWNSHYMSDDAIDAKTIQQWVLLGDPSLKIGGYL